jgi:acyl-CoA synthetase (AMP-forming)/AMP-acid ligase II
MTTATATSLEESKILSFAVSLPIPEHLVSTDAFVAGGENIFPLEIEERLMLRPEISLASVVGLKDERYGEVVAAFVIPADESTRPDKSDLQEFVRQALGRHKTPSHVFWVGPNGVLDSLPMTASGKIQKNKLREWGNAKVKLSLAKL